MPTYLVVSQAAGSAPSFDHVTAADPLAAAQEIRDRYGAGMSVDAEGNRAEIQVGITLFEAVGTITPNEDPDLVEVTYNPRAKVQAIPNLAAGATLPTTVTKVNQILAALRAANVIET